MRMLLLSLLLPLATGAYAQGLTEQLRTCAAIAGSAERLHCYDALHASLQQLQEQSFGQEEERLEAMLEETPESLRATVAEVRPLNDERLLITLENGQVWRQIDINRVSWEAGESVEITRGLFGSFFMRSVEGGRRIRVTRAD